MRFIVQEIKNLSLPGVNIKLLSYNLTETPKRFEWKDYEHLDSDLEGYFDWWAREALLANLISEVFMVEPITIDSPVLLSQREQLKTKMKWKSKQLMKSTTYKPDRCIMWKVGSTSKLFDEFHVDEGSMIIYNPTGAFFKVKRWGDYYYSLIDIKPPVITHMQTSGSTFGLKQKSLWKMGVYVQKVILFPSRSRNLKDFLFTGTWFPERYKLTDLTSIARKQKWDWGDISKM